MTAGPDWTIPPGLRAAYGLCRAIHREHGRTYFLATRLLPRDRQAHVWALYAFARVSDDLVDQPVGDPLETLPRWRERTLAALATGSTAVRAGSPRSRDDEVLAALVHTSRSLGLATEPFADFLDSMVMDLTVSRYATWDDLRGYMRGSAAAIGEMMAPVLGATPPALPRARALGEAFQHTNFVRDVAEDLARGRVYLPLDALAAHGVTVADLEDACAAGRSTTSIRQLVKSEVARGLALYEDARPGLRLVDRRSRPCLRVAFDLYREILVDIAARDHEVFAGRVTVSRAARAASVARALVRT